MSMDFNRRFLEAWDIISAIVPVDLQTAANNGDWVNMSKVHRLVCVLFKKAGTAGDDPVFTLNQATDNADGNVKGLNFTEIWSKVGTLTSIGTWTKTTQAAANTYTDTVSAEAQAIIAVEVLPTMLDMANGFNHVQLVIPDTGSNAQIGCGFYIAGKKYLDNVNSLLD